MLNLGNEIDKQKGQMGTIIELLEEVSINQQRLEERMTTQITIDEDSSKEYLEIMLQLGAETLSEAEEVAQAHCHTRGNATTGEDCCADCTKPTWRVPKAEMCKEAGCSGGCGFEMTVCDKEGSVTACAFPFQHQGKSHHKCITSSSFGPVKRPWCKAEGGGVAFCDCPVVTCTCPVGATLSDDGRTCSGSAALVQVGYPPLGLGQLPAAKLPQAKESSSMLQTLGKWIR